MNAEVSLSLASKESNQFRAINSTEKIKHVAYLSEIPPTTMKNENTITDLHIEYWVLFEN